MNSQFRKFLIFLLILIIILPLCILIIAHLIKDANRDKYAELQQSKEALCTERIRLLTLIKNKQKEIEDAEMKFRLYYPTFRVCIITFWIIFVICSHYYWFPMSDIGCFVDLNATIVFTLLCFNYLLYGEIFDLRELNGQIKERIKNYCYNGKLNIQDDIYEYNKELNQIELKIQAIDREIEKLSI